MTTPSYSRDPIIRENVIALRKARGWSAQRLAEELAAHPGTTLTSRAIIANWENGRKETGVTVDDLAALAAVLEVSPPWSLTEIPICAVCRNVPPAGFSCRSCGRPDRPVSRAAMFALIDGGAA